MTPAPVELSPLLVHLATLGLALAGVAGAALAAYATLLVKDRRRLVNHEYARGVLVRLIDACVTAVKVTQRETVEQLRSALEDRKLTAEEIQTIQRAALERALLYLGEHGRREAARIFGTELEPLLRGKIEEAVLDMKPPIVQLQKPTQPAAPALTGPA